MRHRSLATLLRSGGVLLVALAVSDPATRVVAGQAPAGAKPAQTAKKWTVPRTPDGQPDLQGYWTNSTYVPLERAQGVTKEFYTPEEAQAAIKAAADREAEQ